jgi:hypothetical protein
MRRHLPYYLRMGRWDAVQRYHIRRAAAEYDRLGQDEFLARYGFGPARRYLLIPDGKRYDSNAILGVAYRPICRAASRSDMPRGASWRARPSLNVLVIGMPVASTRVFPCFPAVAGIRETLPCHAARGVRFW